MRLRLFGNHGGEVEIILDDQQGRPLAPAHGCAAQGLICLDLSQGHNRQLHDKTRSLSGNTLQADRAIQYLDQLAGNGQPQAGAAEAPTGRAIDLLESLEDAFVLLRGDTDAGITHHDLQGFALIIQLSRRAADRQLHLAGFGEFQRVGQQVAQDLMQPPAIGMNHPWHPRLHGIEQTQSLELGHGP